MTAGFVLKKPKNGFNYTPADFRMAAFIGGTSLAEDLTAKVSEYPPQTAANKPGRTRTVSRTLKSGAVRQYKVTVGYYKRGVGWYNASGTLSKRRSQRLGSRWQTSNQRTATGGRHLISNSATYAKYVHSKPDQAYFHQKRGWRTMEGAGRRYGKTFREAAQQKATAHLDSVRKRRND